MAETQLLPVKNLKLDLKNFRTVPQSDEVSAIKSIITISPDRFWGLMSSIIEDGYLPTENIIVLKETDKKFIVKEGNRRIACLKIILGYIKGDDLNIPADVTASIAALNKSWKKQNGSVPCGVYEKTDAALVDKIIALTHGKGEKASRDKWSSVATARHSRDMSKAPQPVLDLLEKYIENGQNITPLQQERWAGDYPLTVLEEGAKKIFPRLTYTKLTDFVNAYPKVAKRTEVEEVIREIGLKIIGFPELRNTNIDILSQYGIPPLPPPAAPSPTSAAGASAGPPSPTPAITRGTATGAGSTGSQMPSGTSTAAGGSQPGTAQSSSASAPTRARNALSTTDPKSVKATLKKFNPKGNNRQKVVTLRDEAMNLDLTKNPIAFCFLLRSMFEISAKEYSKDNSLPLENVKTKAGVTTTKEKTLLELLRGATAHLTNNNKNTNMVRELHGALAELAKSESVLSVTSMNQLVHSTTFSIIASDISTMFNNIFPLLLLLNV
jgi:hypothetical protein